MEPDNDARPPVPPLRRRWPRRVAIACAVAVALFLVVPLLWPVPPLQSTVPPVSLADADSQFIDADDLRTHFKTAGSERAPVSIILIHGFGASVFSWRDQLPLLGERGFTVAYDRPPFGLTQRPLPGQWTGASPYGPGRNVDQLFALMDGLGMDRAVLVAHSAGAVVAVNAAVSRPDRVQALVLEAPALIEARSTPALGSVLLRSPQMRRIGPLLVRRIAGGGADEFIRPAYHDPAVVTEDVLAGYRKPLKADNWDKGLYELIAAPRGSSPLESLSSLDVPTLVIAGMEDTFVPWENSRTVAASIPGAEFKTFPQTGHLPHEEYPERFANEIYRFLDALPDMGCEP